MEGRVIGIGGIFHVAKNPKQLYAWYEKHLGLKATPYGFMFEKSDRPKDRGYLQFSMFENNDYMQPSTNAYMINFRVDNLEKLLSKLAASGIKPVKDPEEFDYGKFAHILDPEGNKIELWEPVDEVFQEYNKSHPVNSPD
ncbi:MAG: VOC family protein [Luteibaculum sp.]